MFTLSLTSILPQILRLPDRFPDSQGAATTTTTTTSGTTTNRSRSEAQFVYASRVGCERA